jgi:hypothetical protein
MDWVILDCSVSDLFEEIDLIHYLAKQIPEDKGWLALAAILPLVSDTVYLGLFSEYEQFR